MKRLILLCIVGLSTHAIGAPCTDPATLGALPNDFFSDTAAIQAAIDIVTAAGRGEVCIGEGEWDLTRSAGPYNRKSAINTHGRDITIRGAGQGRTFVRLVGDMGASDIVVVSIDPGAQRVRLREMTIDGRQAFNTDEQTHLVGTSTICAGVTCAPIVDIDIENVTFLQTRPPSLARTGDFIRLIGQTPAMATRGVRIANATFRGSGRSSIGFQRNVHDVIVTGSLFETAVDQDIDSEPTGGPLDANSGIVVTGNIFRSTPGSQGDYAITIGGATPENPMTGIVIAGNVFYGRGIASYRTKNAVIANNVVMVDMKTADGAIQARHVCSGLVVSGNTITRSGWPGPMIKLVATVGFCQQAVVSGNNMQQNTPFSAVWTESVNDLTVSGNSMVWPTPFAGAVGVYAQGNARPVDGLLITGNRMRGAGIAVSLRASPHPVGNVSITGNMADGAVGLSCTGTGGHGRITSSGNSIGPRACSAAIGSGD